MFTLFSSESIPVPLQAPSMLQFRIRDGLLVDAPALPPIERSASSLFEDVPGLEWIAEGPVLSQAEHERFVRDGKLWVAETRSEEPPRLVGFLAAEMPAGRLHLCELSVHRAWQRKGIGAALIDAARRYAGLHGLPSLTLTTFSAIPWCAPAYARLGFKKVPIPDQHLQDVVDREHASGLLAEQRVVMSLDVQISKDAQVACCSLTGAP